MLAMNSYICSLKIAVRLELCCNGDQDLRTKRFSKVNQLFTRRPLGMRDFTRD